MRQLIETRWPLVGALIAIVVVVVVDVSLDGPLFRVRLFGLSQDALGLIGMAFTLAFALQLRVNARRAMTRERNLVHTAAELREASVELDRLARTDGLTGLLNRRALFDMLGAEFRRSRRYSRPLSVLMVDLDNFKRVNDRWGHPFGDYVLRATAHIIAANVRESDILGRYGGEEFALALPETDVSHAIRVAEKLRVAIESFDFRSSGVPRTGEPPLKMTISIGIASLPLEPDQDEFELILRADHSLYEAKQSGKNRVVQFGHGTTSHGVPVSPGSSERTN
ncbi:MAG: GGDEF domain-containing protein [Chloroflexi bacterium]|nr:GGDEF domain-containing protein [Chloroflexota bacterium]